MRRVQKALSKVLIAAGLMPPEMGARSASSTAVDPSRRTARGTPGKGRSGAPCMRGRLAMGAVGRLCGKDDPLAPPLTVLERPPAPPHRLMGTSRTSKALAPPASGSTSFTSVSRKRPGSSTITKCALRSKVMNRLRGASMRSKSALADA